MYKSYFTPNIKNHLSDYVYPIICLLLLGGWFLLSWRHTPEQIGHVWASTFIISMVLFLHFAENDAQGGIVHP